MHAVYLNLIYQSLAVFFMAELRWVCGKAAKGANLLCCSVYYINRRREKNDGEMRSLVSCFIFHCPVKGWSWELKSWPHTTHISANTCKSAMGGPVGTTWLENQRHRAEKVARTVTAKVTQTARVQLLTTADGEIPQSERFVYGQLRTPFTLEQGPH